MSINALLPLLLSSRVRERQDAFNQLSIYIESNSFTLGIEEWKNFCKIIGKMIQLECDTCGTSSSNQRCINALKLVTQKLSLKRHDQVATFWLQILLDLISLVNIIQVIVEGLKCASIFTKCATKEMLRPNLIIELIDKLKQVIGDCVKGINGNGNGNGHENGNVNNNLGNNENVHNENDSNQSQSVDSKMLNVALLEISKFSFFISSLVHKMDFSYEACDALSNLFSILQNSRRSDNMLLAVIRASIYHLDSLRGLSRFQYKKTLDSLIQQFLLHFNCKNALIIEEMYYLCWKHNLEITMADLFVHDLEKNRLQPSVKLEPFTFGLNCWNFSRGNRKFDFHRGYLRYIVSILCIHKNFHSNSSSSLLQSSIDSIGIEIILVYFKRKNSLVSHSSSSHSSSQFLSSDQLKDIFDRFKVASATLQPWILELINAEIKSNNIIINQDQLKLWKFLLSCLGHPNLQITAMTSLTILLQANPDLAMISSSIESLIPKNGSIWTCIHWKLIIFVFYLKHQRSLWSIDAQSGYRNICSSIQDQLFLISQKKNKIELFHDWIRNFTLFNMPLICGFLVNLSDGQMDNFISSYPSSINGIEDNYRYFFDEFGTFDNEEQGEEGGNIEKIIHFDQYDKSPFQEILSQSIENIQKESYFNEEFSNFAKYMNNIKDLSMVDSLSPFMNSSLKFMINWNSLDIDYLAIMLIHLSNDLRIALIFDFEQIIVTLVRNLENLKATFSSHSTSSSSNFPSQDVDDFGLGENGNGIKENNSTISLLKPFSFFSDNVESPSLRNIDSLLCRNAMACLLRIYSIFSKNENLMTERLRILIDDLFEYFLIRLDLIFVFDRTIKEFENLIASSPLKFENILGIIDLIPLSNAYRVDLVAKILIQTIIDKKRQEKDKKLINELEIRLKKLILEYPFLLYKIYRNYPGFHLESQNDSLSLNENHEKRHYKIKEEEKDEMNLKFDIEVFKNYISKNSVPIHLLDKLIMVKGVDYWKKILYIEKGYNDDAIKCSFFEYETHQNYENILFFLIRICKFTKLNVINILSRICHRKWSKELLNLTLNAIEASFGIINSHHLKDYIILSSPMTDKQTLLSPLSKAMILSNENYFKNHNINSNDSQILPFLLPQYYSQLDLIEREIMFVYCELKFEASFFPLLSPSILSSPNDKSVQSLEEMRKLTDYTWLAISFLLISTNCDVGGLFLNISEIQKNKKFKKLYKKALENSFFLSLTLIEFIKYGRGEREEWKEGKENITIIGEKEWNSNRRKSNFSEIHFLSCASILFDIKAKFPIFSLRYFLFNYFQILISRENDFITIDNQFAIDLLKKIMKSQNFNSILLMSIIDLFNNDENKKRHDRENLENLLESILDENDDSSPSSSLSVAIPSFLNDYKMVIFDGIYKLINSSFDEQAIFGNLVHIASQLSLCKDFQSFKLSTIEENVELTEFIRVISLTFYPCSLFAHSQNFHSSPPPSPSQSPSFPPSILAKECKNGEAVTLIGKLSVELLKILSLSLEAKNILIFFICTGEKFANLLIPVLIYAAYQNDSISLGEILKQPLSLSLFENDEQVFLSIIKGIELVISNRKSPIAALGSKNSNTITTVTDNNGSNNLYEIGRILLPFFMSRHSTIDPIKAIYLLEIMMNGDQYNKSSTDNNEYKKTLLHFYRRMEPCLYENCSITDDESWTIISDQEDSMEMGMVKESISSKMLTDFSIDRSLNSINDIRIAAATSSSKVWFKQIWNNPNLPISSCNELEEIEELKMYLSLRKMHLDQSYNLENQLEILLVSTNVELVQKTAINLLMEEGAKEEMKMISLSTINMNYQRLIKYSSIRLNDSLLKLIDSFLQSSIIWRENPEKRELAIKLLKGRVDQFFKIHNLESLDLNIQTFIIRVLSRLAKWLQSEQFERISIIIKVYLEPALNICNQGRIEKEIMAKIYHTCSILHDHQLRTLLEETDIDEREISLGRDRQEIETLKKMIETERSNDNLRALTILEAQFKIEKAQLEQLLRTKNSLLLKTLEMFAKTLEHTDKHDLIVFRLCCLWFENSTNPHVNRVMKQLVQTLPSYKFVPLIYQLASRVAIEKTPFQEALQSLIVRMTCDHLFHCIYQLFALINTSSAFHPSSTGVAATPFTAKRKIIQDDNDFEGQRARVIRSIIDQVCIVGGKKTKGIIGKIESLCKAYIEIAAFEINPETVRSNSILPFEKNWLINKLTDLEDVPIPTKYIPIRPDCDYYSFDNNSGNNSSNNGIKDNGLVRIKSFIPKYRLVGGINVPKIIECIGTDGRVYKQLVKGKDDARQDAVMEQIFILVDRLLKSNKKTRIFNLGLRTYRIIPLHPTAGLLEWVSNTIPFGDYLIGAHEKFRPSDLSARECRQIYKAEHENPTSTIESKLNVFVNAILPCFQPVFHHFFHDYNQSASAQEWWSKKLAFAKSVGVASMVGYIVGLGDRHCQNILLDHSTGEIIQIDLNLIFEAGKNLRIPERVPFRLTRDIVDGLGPLGLEGPFFTSAICALSAMRDQVSSILMLLEVFKYDPLYKWNPSLRATRKKLAQEIMGEDYQNIITTTTSTINNNNNNHKYYSHIYKNPIHHGNNFGESREANSALRKVRDKLCGMEDGAILSVRAQVMYLIQQATNNELLSQMYVGWQPWI